MRIEQEQSIRAAKSLLLILLVVAGLSACSGDKEPDAEKPVEAETVSEPVAETPTIQDVLPMSYGEMWAPWTGDFDGMVERRTIRVVTPYGGYMYYFEDGMPRGAAWELANRLEDHLNEALGRRNVRVFVVVIPLSRDRLIPAVLEGHADIIAADLTVTGMRSQQVAFTRPLLKDINEVVVTGADIDDIATLDDIAGREIHVRRSSSYFEHLQALSASMQERDLEPPTIVELDELLETEDIMDMLNAGMIDMTVLDDYKAGFWSEVFPNVAVRDDLVINEGGSIAWVTRKDSPALMNRLNSFLARYGRGTLIGNDTYNRYLKDAHDLRCTRTITDSDRLQALAETFKVYADRYDFDWLKLVAQAFQESGLRQDRRSSAGAIGIMQIKPTTAADPNVGIDDVTTVDSNVHAGAKYMRFLSDRYFSAPAVTDLDRWLLTLAAYNAGPTRLIRLREEARDKGYDPNAWFNNVEIIAARRIGRETPQYVSNIFKYYSGYQMALAKIDESQRRHGELLGACSDT